MLNRTKTTARRDRVKLQLAESFLKKNWTNKRWLWIWTTGQQRRQRSHALFYPSGLLSHFGFKYKRMIQTDNATMLAAVLNFGSISVYTHVCRGGQDANTRFWGELYLSNSCRCPCGFLVPLSVKNKKHKKQRNNGLRNTILLRHELLFVENLS